MTDRSIDSVASVSTPATQDHGVPMPSAILPHVDWEAKLHASLADHEARAGAPPEAGERPDFQLASVAGASWAAGLAARMLGRDEEARSLLGRAADEYVASWKEAPAGSWGRPIAAIRCRLLAGDGAGAAADARRALESGAAEADGPIAGYCATLSLLALGRDASDPVALERARALEDRVDFQPGAVARALSALAARDASGYATASSEVLGSFEERDAFLEDVPVADTVIVLDELARARGIDPPRRTSRLLPP